VVRGKGMERWRERECERREEMKMGTVRKGV
jgi:hypothetical protein